MHIFSADEDYSDIKADIATKAKVTYKMMKVLQNLQKIFYLEKVILHLLVHHNIL